MDAKKNQNVWEKNKTREREKEKNNFFRILIERITSLRKEKERHHEMHASTKTVTF